MEGREEGDLWKEAYVSCTHQVAILLGTMLLFFYSISSNLILKQKVSKFTLCFKSCALCHNGSEDWEDSLFHCDLHLYSHDPTMEPSELNPWPFSQFCYVDCPDSCLPFHVLCSVPYRDLHTPRHVSMLCPHQLNLSFCALWVTWSITKEVLSLG